LSAKLILSVTFVKKSIVMSKIVGGKKVNQLITELKSGDAKKISKALKGLASNGNSSVIKPLADVLMTELSPDNRSEILELLCSLKDSSVCVEIMEVICDPNYLPIRQEILTTIWNTKVDFSDYNDDFVEIATKGSLIETLDCLTIIENLEGPFMEENILECQLHLKNYLENTQEKDPKKSEFLSEIALIIKDINQNLMDD